MTRASDYHHKRMGLHAAVIDALQMALQSPMDSLRRQYMVAALDEHITNFQHHENQVKEAVKWD